MIAVRRKCTWTDGARTREEVESMDLRFDTDTA